MVGGETLEAHVKVGDVIADKYRVDELLGLGGMGAVFAATHLELDERVAVKFLLPTALGDEATLKRFAREARAVVKLKNEHVVRVFDVGKLSTGLPFMVMELLSGVDLGKLTQDRGNLPVPEVVDIVLQALQGIAEAHAVGVVHRDLKPGNLFATKRRDGSTCIKVLDFGISKTTRVDPSAALTQTSTVVGSPSFMCPEQWLAAKDVDGRADIWSVGAIMFQLLAGRPPFEGDTVAHLCTAILHGDPASLRELREDVDEELERVVLRCLEKDRDARYRDVGELAYALEPFAPAASRSAVASIAAVAGSARDVAAAPPSDPGTASASGARMSSPSRVEEPKPSTMTNASLSDVVPPRRGPASRIGLAALALLAGASVVALVTSLRSSPALVAPPARETSAAPERAPEVAPPPVVESVTKTDEAASSPGGSESAPTAVIATPAPIAKRPAAPAVATPAKHDAQAPAASSAPPTTTFKRGDLGGRH